jgi:V8-like Glu-specific endopeptidase
MAVFGSPKCSVFKVEEQQFRYEFSTRGGSSGSPVLAANGREVLGMHFLRDMAVGGGVAVRADSIRQTSTRLR